MTLRKIILFFVPKKWLNREKENEESDGEENSDDTKIRKKFTIENDCFIFYGEGKDFFLSSARELAILSCEKKLNDLCSSNDMSIKIFDIKGLITVTDHWYQTSDGIYTYYVFYKISKKSARKSYK